MFIISGSSGSGNQNFCRWVSTARENKNPVSAVSPQPAMKFSLVFVTMNKDCVDPYFPYLENHPQTKEGFA